MLQRVNRLGEARSASTENVAPVITQQRNGVSNSLGEVGAVRCPFSPPDALRSLAHPGAHGLVPGLSVDEMARFEHPIDVGQEAFAPTGFRTSVSSSALLQMLSTQPSPSFQPENVPSRGLQALFTAHLSSLLRAGLAPGLSTIILSLVAFLLLLAYSSACNILL